MGFKHCSKCREARPLQQFRKRKESSDGHGYECDICRSARRRARYGSDAVYRRRILDAQRAINAANPEANRAKARAWAVANPDRVKLQKTYCRRRDLDGYNAYQREWRSANKGTANAGTARRYASKTSATPAWANARAILKVYKMARVWNMQVDHIVPLRSRLVCGLHVPANLQLLMPEENLAKRNSYWPDMPT